MFIGVIGGVGAGLFRLFMGWGRVYSDCLLVTESTVNPPLQILGDRKFSNTIADLSSFGHLAIASLSFPPSANLPNFDIPLLLTSNTLSLRDNSAWMNKLVLNLNEPRLAPQSHRV